MRFITRIEEGQIYTETFIGYVWRPITDYRDRPPVRIGRWFELIINLGWFTFTWGIQFRKRNHE